MKRILLLVDNPGNRKVLSGFLAKNYELTVGKDDESILDDFDLCIVDAPAFRRTKTMIHRQKEAQKPVFLPFLLIATIDEFRSIASSSTHLIDELLLTPVTPEVMQTRINRMFEEQENSITLKKTRDNAIEKLKKSNEMLEKRVEERAGQIVESQKLLQSIINNSPAIISLKDTEGRYMLINREYEKSMDVSSRKILGKTDFSIHPEEIAEAMVVNDRKVLDSKKAMSFEEELSRPDGIYTYLSVKFPVKNALGETYGVCGISTDITDRKHVEAKLKAERRRLDTILKTLPVGVLIADAGGRIYHANNVAKAIWSVSSLDQLNERKGRFARNGDTLQNDDWGLMRSIKTGKPSVGKIIDIDKFDGSQATILDSSAPLKNSQGVIEGAVAIVQDMTEQRQRERLSDSLNRINSIIFSTIDFSNIITEVLTMTVEATGCEAAAVGIIKGSSIEFEHTCKMPQEITGEKLPLKDAPILSLVINSKKIAVVDDAFNDDRVSQQIVRKYNIRSLAIVPLIAHGKVFATISYYYMSEPKAFSELQLDFLYKLGASMSLALQNSDLYNSMQREITRIALLKEIASATTSALSITDVCNEILEVTNSYLDAKLGSIYYYNEEQAALEHLALFGWPGQVAENIKRIPMEADSNQVKVIRQGLPLMTHESTEQAQISQDDVKASGLENSRWFIIPIKSKGKHIGNFSLAFKGLRPFAGDEISLYKSIAEQLGIAIDNAMLFESEVAARAKAKDELEVSNALRQTADNLAISLDLPDIFDSLADTVLNVTTLKRVTINIREESTNEIATAISKGQEAFHQGAKTRMEELPTAVRNAWEDNKPVIIDTESPDVPENERDSLRALNIRLMLYVPILLGGKAFALIMASDPGKKHPFEEKEIRIIQGIASQASIALERARFYEALQQELVRTNILKDVAAIASSALNIDQITSQILGIIERRLHLKAGSIHLYNKEANNLRLLKATKQHEEAIKQLDEIQVNNETFMGRIVLTGTEYVTHETPGQTQVSKEIVKRIGLENDRWILMAIPIRDRIVGVINLAFEGKRPFEYAEKSLYRSIAEQLGVAIENARLYEAEVEAKRRATIELEISKLLGKTSQILASAVEMPKLINKLNDLGDIVRKFTGRGRVMISLVDHQKRELKVVAVSGISNVKVGSILNFDYLVKEFRNKIISNKQSAVIDYDSVPSKDKKMLDDYGILSALAVPVTAKGQTIANILIDEPDQKAQFKEREVRIVESLASQLGVAMERARLYEAERTIADTLQTALLTIPDTIKGIEFSHIYRSATEIARVGGDFYDLFELEHGKVGILLGDVSGKGLSAAALTSLVKNIVKSYALEGESPGKIISRANDIVYRESAAGTFVTVFMGILDLRTGQLSYCNAGHPQPVLKKASGKTEFVNDTSPVIGVFESYSYPVSQTTIEIGDALILYTDGVIEARRDKKFYGDDRLLRTVSSLKAGTKDLTAEIYNNVNDFTNGNLTDDLAIVTISLSEEPAAFARTRRAA